MSEVRDAALAILSRREYTRAELKHKLLQKGFEVTTELLDDLAQQGLQSDQRFVEHLFQVRMAHGYGPRHIAMELQSKEVAPELIAAELEHVKDQWLPLAQAVRQKKFGASWPDAQHQPKQIQFLLYRGFAMATIEQLLQQDA